MTKIIKGNNAVTLLELLVVVIIIVILVTLSILTFGSGKEGVYTKEAIYNLKLLQAAERSYRVDMGTYYPSSGTVSVVDTINDNLGLALPAASSRIWNYAVKDTGCVQATRNGGDARSRYLDATSLDPSTGTCP
jgi:type II secretory pathway pseudopilin PulG